MITSSFSVPVTLSIEAKVEIVKQYFEGQVLTNYLANALKYAPVDQPVSVRLEVAASSARVSVRDLGMGLTAEQQQWVWERFYQVAAPGHQGPDGGLGLGLAIARAIVEQHHGQPIEVSSAG